jgi:hypothetical protein
LKRKRALLGSNLPGLSSTDWNGQALPEAQGFSFGSFQELYALRKPYAA